MNNPFEYVPDGACDEAFRRLVGRLEALKASERPDDRDFSGELEAGKMLGVLIAEDAAGKRHTLYAFSGQSGVHGFYREGFVGPVFDYLAPGGYFKTHESEISRQNIEIDRFENDIYRSRRDEYDSAKARADAEIASYKEFCAAAKRERQAQREAGGVTDDEQAAMVRRSQFEKAELRRRKKQADAMLEPLATSLDGVTRRLEAMKAKRRADSEALQQWLFNNFKVLNARGESKSLSEIFASEAGGIPPSGAGECCGPKLLQAAYLQGWLPVAMAEYWYGKSKSGEVRIHGEHYPACRGKCRPVLGWMLQGLTVEPPLDSDSCEVDTYCPEIIFENQWFCVVDKPSGMLSVPGKGQAVSVEQWLVAHYGAERDVKVAHRLDQDTSGLLVATFGALSYKVMQSLFATRRAAKTYVAVLDGDYRSRGLARQGRIALPLSPDWLDRPRQRVDFEGGKEAVTDYEFTAATDGQSRVIFRPHTGRTHQLRVHAASDAGLAMPIAGDRLYGLHSCSHHQRLHLHAHKLEFTFPLTGRHYSFESPVPF